MSERARRTRILLLTPYDGGNLGDRAIQEAVIDNIRRRAPSEELVGITLFPARTSRLHGYRCEVLTHFALPYYTPVHGPERTTPRPTGDDSTARRTPLKDFLRRFPMLFHVAKTSAAALRRLLNGTVLIAREARHLGTCWAECRASRLLIVAGGGQLDDEWGGPWGHPYVLLKWSCIARLAGTGVAYFSVGYCDLKSWLSRRFIRAALRLADYHSYRDDRSASEASKLSRRSDARMVPDLAFSYAWPRSSSTAIRAGIAINPIAYLSPRYWPRSDRETHERYVSQLTDVLVRLLKDGETLTLFSTASPDVLVVNELLERVRGILALTGPPPIRVSHPRDVPELLALLSGARFVVASRLHAVILAHLAGTPVVALQYDTKVAVHMLAMGMHDYCADIHDFSAQELLRKLDALRAAEQPVTNTIHERAGTFAGQLAAQYDSFFVSR